MDKEENLEQAPKDQQELNDKLVDDNIPTLNKVYIAPSLTSDQMPSDGQQSISLSELREQIEHLMQKQIRKQLQQTEKHINKHLSIQLDALFQAIEAQSKKNN